MQQELPGQIGLDVSYVGNVVKHLMYQRDINTLPLGTTVNTPILTNANNDAGNPSIQRLYQRDLCRIRRETPATITVCKRV